MRKKERVSECVCVCVRERETERETERERARENMHCTILSVILPEHIPIIATINHDYY